MAIVDKNGFFRGPIGKVSLRYYRGKQIAQSKSENVNQTLASKESSFEFGLCSGSARVMREAFSPTFVDHDGAMVNRFTSLVRNTFTACRHKERGERDMHDVDLNHLTGFQFNNNSPLNDVLQIRVKAGLNEEGKLQVTVPGLNTSYIKGISANYYMLKFLAVSFDFKTECYRYHPLKSLRIDGKRGFEGEIIELEDSLPKGRVVLLSMSLHAYAINSLDEEILLNSKKWSPSEIIGAWHIPKDEEVPVSSFNYGQATAEAKDISCPYNRERLLNKIREIKALHFNEDKSSEGPPKVLQQAARDLPKGDIGFRK